MKMRNIIIAGDPLFNDMDICRRLFLSPLSFILLFLFYVTSFLLLNSAPTLALKILFRRAECLTHDWDSEKKWRCQQ